MRRGGLVRQRLAQRGARCRAEAGGDEQVAVEIIALVAGERWTGAGGQARGAGEGAESQ